MTAANKREDVFQLVEVKGQNDCWPWKGRRDEKGYGGWDLQGRSRKAHQVVYEVSKGPIPEGMEVMHDCRNRGCCNPMHLYAGTHAENMRARQGRLPAEEIKAIKRSTENQYKLALRYGVSQSTISRIKKHPRFYKDVT